MWVTYSYYCVLHVLNRAVSVKSCRFHDGTSDLPRRSDAANTVVRRTNLICLHTQKRLVIYHRCIRASNLSLHRPLLSSAQTRTYLYGASLSDAVISCCIWTYFFKAHSKQLMNLIYSTKTGRLSWQSSTGDMRLWAWPSWYLHKTFGFSSCARSVLRRKILAAPSNSFSNGKVHESHTQMVSTWTMVTFMAGQRACVLYSQHISCEPNTCHSYFLIFPSIKLYNHQRWRWHQTSPFSCHTHLVTIFFPMA